MRHQKENVRRGAILIQMPERKEEYNEEKENARRIVVERSRADTLAVL